MYKDIEKTINIGLLGVGTVGSGVVELLEKNSQKIAQKANANIKIKTILVRNPDTKEKLEKKGYKTTQSIDDIVNDKDISIVIELIGGIEPAKTYMEKSLENGKYVITANKDVIALYGEELLKLSEKHNVDVFFEAAVGGGIPIIRPLKKCLAANNIESIIGIVNGTTNYMLTKMTEEGLEYDVVLKECQEKGYAEKDPTADVGGFDAARKIAILSSIAFNTKVDLDKVFVEGIESISSHDIKYATEFGYVIKLLAIAKNIPEHGIDVRVHATLLPKEHPLSSVNGVFNAIFVTGDFVGDTMFYGQGAGKNATASAVCSDVIDACRHIVNNSSSRIMSMYFENINICSPNIVETPFYMRMSVKDRPGVLASIAAAFGTNNVGIRSVVQKQRKDEYAELVLITHKVSYENILLAAHTLKALPVVDKIFTLIRVEDNNFI